MRRTPSTRMIGFDDPPTLYIHGLDSHRHHGHPPSVPRRPRPPTRLGPADQGLLEIEHPEWLKEAVPHACLVYDPQIAKCVWVDWTDQTQPKYLRLMAYTICRAQMA